MSLLLLNPAHTSIIIKMSAFIFAHLTITFPWIPKLFFHTLKIVRSIDYFMLADSESKVLPSLFLQLVSVEPDLLMTNVLLGSVCLRKVIDGDKWQFFDALVGIDFCCLPGSIATLDLL